jgi:hypothetical protein
MAVPVGPTGRFPQGDVGRDDNGELQVAVATDYQHAVVRIVFGAPVGWLALPAEEARALAQMLVEKADELDRRRT